MTLHTWLLFMATEFVLVITPGPAVLFVVSHGLRYGRSSAIWANLGILSGNVLYFALSAFGLGAVLLASHDLFTAIRYAGAVYLVYLGVSTFFGRGLALPPEDDQQLPAVSGRRILFRGFALQAANPKALLFFAALLPQFIRPEGDPATQIAILAVSSTAIEFVMLAAYGIFAAAASRKAREPRFARLTNRVSGAMLVGAGTGIGIAGR
jgi:homoserine/homoserine lactone efflux protein